jgi:hypothetical protein
MHAGGATVHVSVVEGPPRLAVLRSVERDPRFAARFRKLVRSPRLDVDAGSCGHRQSSAMRHAVNVSFCAVSLLTVFFAGSPDPGAPSPTARRCPATTWTPPRRVEGEPTGQSAVARWPSLAPGPRGAFVVGVDIPSFDASIAPSAPLTAWRIGGEGLGKPSGQFVFAFPKAVVGDDGHLHVVWAEPDDHDVRVPTLDWPPGPLTSLWSATYTERSGWSTPALVARGRELGWEDAQVLRSLRGEVVITTPGQVAGMSVRGAVMLRLDGDAWRVVPVVTASPVVSYTTLAVDGERFYLAFVAPGRSSGGGPNSVFVQRSTDAGATWSESVLVSHSAVEPAYDLRALIGADRRVHLVWRQKTAQGGSLLQHVASADGAITWGRIDGLPVGAIASPHATFDGCGTLHVVFEGWSPDGEVGRLYHATWAGQWKAPTPLFVDRSVTSHDLQRGADGEPTIVFLTWSTGAASERRPETAYSILR